MTSEDNHIEPISYDESMSLEFEFFKGIATVGAQVPEAVFEDYGHLYSAGELRFDLLCGRPLLTWGDLPSSVKDKMSVVIDLLDKMPQKAYCEGKGLEELKHPAWAAIRGALKDFNQECPS